MRYDPPPLNVAAFDRVTLTRAWVGYLVFFCFPDREERFISGYKLIHHLRDKRLGLGYVFDIPFLL